MKRMQDTPETSSSCILMGMQMQDTSPTITTVGEGRTKRRRSYRLEEGQTSQSILLAVENSSVSNVDSIPSRETRSKWLYAQRSGPPKTNIDQSKIGKWLLFLNQTHKNENGLTKLDLCWPPIKSLVEAGLLHSAKCSTACVDENYSYSSDGVIICYTSDYTNKEDVKQAADCIRKFVDYPKPLYYKTDNATTTGQYSRHGYEAVSLYQHTVDGKFSERNSRGNWKAVNYSKPPAWAGLTEPFIDSESFQESSRGMIPSEITDFDWLYSKAADDARPSVVNPYLCGKWTLKLDCSFKDGNKLTELDRCWPSIVELFDKNIVKLAKCTNSSLARARNLDEGVIICYINNYAEKKEVKAVADAIREVVNYPRNMYYKKRDCPRSRWYEDDEEEGDKIREYSVYLHRPDSTFYMRGSNEEWVIADLTV